MSVVKESHFCEIPVSICM